VPALVITTSIVAPALGMRRSTIRFVPMTRHLVMVLSEPGAELGAHRHRRVATGVEPGAVSDSQSFS
jgi:hypothetical protein